MKIDKKEQVMWLVILVIIALFIIFMPQIESLIAGRKVKGNDSNVSGANSSNNQTGEIHEVNYPSETNCTLPETLDQETGANLQTGVTFTYSTSGTVEKINTVKTYKYADVAKYNEAKATKAATKNGVTETITRDDTNMILTITTVMNISEMDELTEYPAGYTELNKYLSTNQYTCTEKK